MNAAEAPRLRMFAGPNGSGKSTIKTVLRPALLEWYLNADEIEAAIRQQEFFDLGSWQLAVEESELRAFLLTSTLLTRANLTDQASNLPFQDNRVFFASGQINSYYASVLVDFVRRKFVALNRSFTFETVMSSPDKIEFLQSARDNGFRTYLYFVATQNPKINIDRVARRVREGGHDVPVDKIIARYHRSLNLLSDAIRASDRAYIFDNSGRQLDFIAEYENGQRTRLVSQSPPLWFEDYVLDKLT